MKHFEDLATESIFGILVKHVWFLFLMSFLNIAL